MTSRRQFLATIPPTASIGIAGCSNILDNKYRFDDVPEKVQERVYRVDERLADLVGQQPEGPITIRSVEEIDRGEEIRSRFEELVFRAQHISVEDPEVPSDATGSGRHQRTDGESVVLLAEESPTDSVIAHELFHAVQWDMVGRVSPDDRTRDGIAAHTSVTEGAATYVSNWYGQQCGDETFEPCHLRSALSLPEATTPAILAFGVQQYLTGSYFIHNVYERDGWEGVWEAHRSPPQKTSIMAKPDGGESASYGFWSPSEPRDPDGWLQTEDDRLGMYALYAKLFALDIATFDESFARAPDSYQTRTGFEYLHRSRLLTGWEGDLFRAYGNINDPDRQAYEWQVKLETASGAAELAESVETAYRDHGAGVDVGWRFNDAVHSVERDESRVTFRMAADTEGHRHLFLS